jgi:hypothetical protein
VGTVPNLVLVANNTWVGTQRLTAASGEFKFAANGNWTTTGAETLRVSSAGGGFRVGAERRQPQVRGLSNGLYRFTFNDSTREFRLEWAEATSLPLATYTNVAVVGDFKGGRPTPTAN